MSINCKKCFFLHCQVLDFFVKQSELKRTIDPLKIDAWHCLGTCRRHSKTVELKRTIDPLNSDTLHCLELAEDIQGMLNSSEPLIRCILNFGNVGKVFKIIIRLKMCINNE